MNECLNCNHNGIAHKESGLLNKDTSCNVCGCTKYTPKATDILSQIGYRMGYNNRFGLIRSITEQIIIVGILILLLDITNSATCINGSIPAKVYNECMIQEYGEGHLAKIDPDTPMIEVNGSIEYAYFNDLNFSNAFS